MTKHQQTKRPTWYLMKAHNINDGRNASLSAIIKQHMGQQYTVYVTMTDKPVTRLCICSGHDNRYSVVSKINWINDTGRGHRQPAYNDDTMTIQNIIQVNSDGSIKFKINDIGITGSFSTVVFK